MTSFSTPEGMQPFKKCFWETFVCFLWVGILSFLYKLEVGRRNI
jgi:hypothetical protein